MHSVEDLYGERGDIIYNQLKEFQNQGLLSKIGCSIYRRDQLNKLKPSVNLDIVQSPFNILDQSFFYDVHKKENNFEFHARSIFLQGLLLMDSNLRPSFFSKWNKLFKKYEEFLELNKLNKVEFCLLSVLQDKRINKTLVGLEKIDQLKKL